jgi:ABC-type antimicrobial peptide transport system permease subunit
LIPAYKQILDEIHNLPGVEDISLSAAVPIRGTYIPENVRAVGGSNHHFHSNSVGPDYFKTLRTPLLGGREFRWTDTNGTGRRVILSRSAAKLLFPRGDSLGRRVIFENGNVPAEVVGLVEDSKYGSLRDLAPPMVYSAATQSLIGGASLAILVRTKGSVTPLIAAAGKVMKRVVPDVPSVPTAMSMEETIAESLVTERIMSTLALFFGGLALFITGIGLYGTLAYSTERRTGEIGIRLALGAQPRNVISMVCAENSLITLLGCFAGIAGSALASKTIASVLYGVSAHDPAVFGAAAAMLLCVAGAASLAPAVKAARIDPLAAIRHE